MGSIQNLKKVNHIHNLCKEIVDCSKKYSSASLKSYYDYDGVIKLLDKAKEVLEKSARCPPIETLPDNIVWCNKFYDVESEFSIYVYDGSMSAEDFQKVQEMITEEEEEL